MTASNLFGSPGSGLSSSNFSNSNIAAGQKGEQLFAKALLKAGLLGPYASFWSLYMPTTDLQRLDDSDIDCVLLSGNTVFCIDLKMYKQGNLTYRNDGDYIYAIDNVTGGQVGETKRVSHQMERVQQTMSTAFAPYNTGGRPFTVKSMVVLMPSPRGMGDVRSLWPGGIPAYNLPSALSILQNELVSPFNPLDAHNCQSDLRSLVKA